MRRDNAYLQDICLACDDISAFVHGFTLKTFLQDKRMGRKRMSQANLDRILVATWRGR